MRHPRNNIIHTEEITPLHKWAIKVRIAKNKKACTSSVDCAFRPTIVDSITTWQIVGPTIKYSQIFP